MVNKSIRISLMVIGWLLMTCALRAETIPFSAAGGAAAAGGE